MQGRMGHMTLGGIFLFDIAVGDVVVLVQTNLLRRACFDCIFVGNEKIGL